MDKFNFLTDENSFVLIFKTFPDKFPKPGDLVTLELKGKRTVEIEDKEYNVSKRALKQSRSQKAPLRAMTKVLHAGVEEDEIYYILDGINKNGEYFTESRIKVPESIPVLVEPYLVHKSQIKNTRQVDPEKIDSAIYVADDESVVRALSFQTLCEFMTMSLPEAIYKDWKEEHIPLSSEPFSYLATKEFMDEIDSDMPRCRLTINSDITYDTYNNANFKPCNERCEYKKCNKCKLLIEASKPSIAVEYLHTIATKDDKFKKHALEVLQTLQNEYEYDIVLWTTESHRTDEIAQKCKEKGLLFDWVMDTNAFKKQIEGVNKRKVDCDYYIDSRNVGFVDDWALIFKHITGVDLV